MTNLINDAAAVIAFHDTDAATAFIEQPFNRVALAYAFARGLAKSPTDDIHPHAQAVICAAYYDREQRAQSN